MLNKEVLKNIKAVSCDLDGTITEYRGTYLLSIDALIALRKLEENNIKVILNTGNPVPVVIKFPMYFGTTGPVIAENGCFIYYKKKVIANTDINTTPAKNIILEKYGNILEEHWTNPYRIYDFAFIVKDKSINMRKLIEDIKRDLQPLNLDIDVRFSGYAIHVWPRHVDKGVALKKACELINVKLDEVVAIGDGDLDLPALKVAKIGVAMSDSSEALKQVADYITKSPGGKGVLEFVNLLLKAKQT